MPLITMPKVLREKLGEDGADAFASVIKNLETDWRKDLATKEDLMKETNSIRLDMERIKLEIEKIKGELTLIKWMLGIVLAGVISLVMKTFFP
ncbi:hypothetical protein MCHI_003494 [Candidatus Magnetoovum chiemensis]|nr:hypothetical protein MCHI_003494 [Candidatus Magnetoovum chiemensis]